MTFGRPKLQRRTSTASAARVQSCQIGFGYAPAAMTSTHETRPGQRVRWSWDWQSITDEQLGVRGEHAVRQ